MTDVRHETDELLKMAVIPNSAAILASLRPIHCAKTKSQSMWVQGAADPTLRLPTDDSEEYRADSSEEVSSPEIEALVGLVIKIKSRNVRTWVSAVTFETIDATDEEHGLDAQDEQDPAPLVTPNSGGDIQWVVDKSEGEPIETWDAPLRNPLNTPQQDEEGLAADSSTRGTASWELGTNDMSDSDDYFSIGEEEEEEEFDTVRPSQPSLCPRADRAEPVRKNQAHRYA